MESRLAKGIGYCNNESQDRIYRIEREVRKPSWHYHWAGIYLFKDRRFPVSGRVMHILENKVVVFRNDALLVVFRQVGPLPIKNRAKVKNR